MQRLRGFCGFRGSIARTHLAEQISIASALVSVWQRGVQELRQVRLQHARTQKSMCAHEGGNTNNQRSTTTACRGAALMHSLRFVPARPADRPTSRCSELLLCTRCLLDASHYDNFFLYNAALVIRKILFKGNWKRDIWNELQKKAS